MLVKKIFAERKYGKVVNFVTGWYLFGFIPLYVVRKTP